MATSSISPEILPSLQSPKQLFCPPSHHLLAYHHSHLILSLTDKSLFRIPLLSPSFLLLSSIFSPSTTSSSSTLDHLRLDGLDDRFVDVVSDLILKTPIWKGNERWLIQNLIPHTSPLQSLSLIIILFTNLLSSSGDNLEGNNNNGRLDELVDDIEVCDALSSLLSSLQPPSSNNHHHQPPFNQDSLSILYQHSLLLQSQLSTISNSSLKSILSEIVKLIQLE